MRPPSSHLHRNPPSALAVVATVATALAGLAGCASQHRTADVKALPRPPVARNAAAVRPTYPLTGLPAPSAAAAARPVLAVKIDNVAGSFPQWGVNRADVVVEEVVEGGLTRLVAAFQSKGATRVGPIRSARPVDADLERLWNGGLLAYSGAAPGEIRPSVQHGHALLVDATTEGWPFYRAGGYGSPHNLFSSTAALYRAAGQLAKQAHKTVGSMHRPLFDFGKPAGRPAGQVSLSVSPATYSHWRYSPSRRKYLRWQDGSADLIAGAGQVVATNVVVMQVRLKQTPIIDPAGNHDPLDVILGTGKAWVFSRGLVAAGTWSRPNDAAPMTLRSGPADLHLAPGVTWVELLPTGRSPRIAR